MLDCVWASYTYPDIRVCTDTDRKEIVIDVGEMVRVRMSIPEALYFLIRLAERIQIGVAEAVKQ